MSLVHPASQQWAQVPAGPPLPSAPFLCQHPASTFHLMLVPEDSCEHLLHAQHLQQSAYTRHDKHKDENVLAMARRLVMTTR